MFLAADTGRLFGLDMQMIFGMAFQAISILILFAALSYILFEPARKILEDRKARIAKDVASAKQDKEEAVEYKAEYEAKRKNIEKEADVILSEARKKALVKENEIIVSAKTEAAGIVAQAKKDAELEVKKAKDDIKQQIIDVATLMAGKIVTVSLDDEDQANLIQETLKEIGEEIWLS